MDFESVSCESKDRTALACLVIAFIMSVIIHFSLSPVISRFYPAVNMQVLFYIRVLILSVLLCISIQLVIGFFLRGFIVQGILNGCFFFTNCIWLFYSGKAIAFDGLCSSLLSVVIGLGLVYKLQKIDEGYKELNRIAFSDDLTGLINRKKVVSTISNLIAAKRDFCIMFIDMDNFKIINDSLGHPVGNIFLNEVVHNIDRIVDPKMLFGRMGGDEFMLIIPYVMNHEDLVKFADEVNKVVSMPFLYKNRSYIVTCSIGIAQYPADADSTLDMLRHADMALYRAKGFGKKQAVFYDQQLQHDFDERLKMESELHTAIENDELYLMFQPEFDVEENRIRAYETFVRWKSPVFGEIHPAQFIPIAEENGDILQIGHWVMETAFTRFVQKLNEKKIDPNTLLCLNISFVEFRSPLFIEELKESFSKTGLTPDKLELEITEFVCVHSPETAIERLRELTKMGVKVALDDFGTGYASLSYLRSLPFSVVKIDKTLIDTIDEQNSDTIVRSIIDLAHTLKRKVVAEGVEQEIQYSSLVKWNCDYIQGFYLSKPVI